MGVIGVIGVIGGDWGKPRKREITGHCVSML